MNIWALFRACWIVLAITTASGPASTQTGRIVDAVTGKGISGAIVTAGNETTNTDENGNFGIDAGHVLMARAPGYRASRIEELQPSGAVIRLTRFTPKALYLSFYGIGSAALREPALDLIQKSDRLNALVIDVKNDRGLIPFKSDIPLAHELGTDKITTIPDAPALLNRLHAAGVYAIARIVVFKDEPLASARQDLAVKTTAGGLFRDNEKLAWTDPFRREVWDYNIDIAEEAARAGFDEIQFDYMRFPDMSNVRFSQASTMQSRTAAIRGFLTEARRRLAPYNVFIAADIFGYVCWNTDDTGIGQKLEDIVPLVDYVSPMLYPSGFTFGIPGFKNPVEHPYEIVRLSLDRALARTHVSPLRFRPWLQAFRDYAFDRRAFDTDDMEPQITAADQFASDGWMIWNPRNVYTDMGF
jgi:hypothetical protein